VYLYLGPRWKGKVQGLCGNYDGIVKNEFGGTGATALFEYLNSMKKSSSCPDLEAEDVSPEPCKVKNNNNNNPPPSEKKKRTWHNRHDFHMNGNLTDILYL
jgi:hypothetical protein